MKRRRKDQDKLHQARKPASFAIQTHLSSKLSLAYGNFAGFSQTLDDAQKPSSIRHSRPKAGIPWVHRKDGFFACPGMGAMGIEIRLWLCLSSEDSTVLPRGLNCVEVCLQTGKPEKRSLPQLMQDISLVPLDTARFCPLMYAFKNA